MGPKDVVGIREMFVSSGIRSRMIDSRAEMRLSFSSNVEMRSESSLRVNL